MQAGDRGVERAWTNPRGENLDDQSGMFKKLPLALFGVCRRKGGRPFDARSVLIVRERERREERQVCEPEGPTKGRERR